MKIAIAYGAWSLTFRKTLDLGPDVWDDPRGLSGSEMAVVRLAEELEADVYSVGKGCRDLKTLAPRASRYDAIIAVNEPELLRGLTPFKAAGGPNKRICYHLINSFEFCKLGFERSVDLFLSPSTAHRDMILGMRHEVETGAKGAAGYYEPDPESWRVVELGCDPEKYQGTKVPGRCVYTSSPDRGLHWLLQEWPRIKRAVPHATLKIFYRLKPWIENLKQQPYFPPIEGLRARAIYIEECLWRLRDPKWGITVCDSVSRNQLARELSEAECLTYPCDTVRWSEGFSCSLLEGCAAGAAPVSTDCDAFPAVYGASLDLIPRGEWARWGDQVIRTLMDPEYRESVNARARALGERLTWQRTAEQIKGLL